MSYWRAKFPNDYGEYEITFASKYKYKTKIVEKVCQAIIDKKVDSIDDISIGNTDPQWIPVTERLPDLIPCNAGTAYSEAVIVWTDGKKAMVAVWDGIDFLCAADYWEAWGENITHWMPLPEPPKDGEKE